MPASRLGRWLESVVGGSQQEAEPAGDAARAQRPGRLAATTYADHAGAALYDDALLAAAFRDLASTLHTNPHSQHAVLSGGGGSGGSADAVRAATLSFLHAPPDYACVLTSGATAGLALVAASFPWAPGSRYAHTRDNHTSVLGVRAAALAAGGAVVVVEPDDGGGGLAVVAGPFTRPAGSPGAPGPSGRVDGEEEEAPATATPCLFAFPLESNFSGARYPADLGRGLASGGGGRAPTSTTSSSSPSLLTPAPGEAWFILMDAAKACSSGQPPDLGALAAAGRAPVDFLPLSFYKLFGAPTGLGALICSPRGLAALQAGRRYWGGGTVAAVTAAADFVRLRAGPAGLEDGTPDFLGAALAARGWAAYAAGGGAAAVAGPAHAAAARLAAALADLSHANGRRVAVLYGCWPGGRVEEEEEGGSPAWAAGGPPRGAAGQGPVVAFNLLTPHGQAVPYRSVERLAALHGVLVRGGAVCNPGAAEAALGLGPADAAAAAAAGRACWDGGPAAGPGGGPAGVVRASFGRESTAADADAVLGVVTRYFVSGGAAAQAQAAAGQQVDLLPRPAPVPAPSRTGPPARVATVDSMWVYPLKGAAGFAPPGGAWPLRGGPGGGLAFDRGWAAVGRPGGGGQPRPLGARDAPRLATIAARVDLAPGGAAFLVLSTPDGRSLRVDAADAAAGGQASAAWLSAALGVPCALARSGGDGGSPSPPASSSSFANETDLLVLGLPSLTGLAGRLAAAGADPAAAAPHRFRPNLVLRMENEDGADGAAHAEDGWARLWLGRVAGPAFTSAGPCARCGAVNMEGTPGAAAAAAATTPPGGEGGGSRPPSSSSSSTSLRQPLLALAAYRRAEGGGILFGALFNREEGGKGEGGEAVVRVGDGVWAV